MPDRITCLVLTRKPGEAIQIGETKITVIASTAQHARIMIEAPESVRIRRCELPEKGEENELDT